MFNLGDEWNRRGKLKTTILKKVLSNGKVAHKVGIHEANLSKN